MRNAVSVSPMAVVGFPLAEQVRILDAQGVGHFGLTVTACQTNGWQESLVALQEVQGSLAHLCHGASASADDDEGWARETAILTRAVDFAAEAGAPWVYFTTGRQSPVLWEEAAERVAGHLAPLVD